MASMGLSPVAVVIAAIFWFWLWGPLGLIMSTPLTLCLVVLGRRVDRLEFLDVLLGDRPALTPIENFYQRMLADDLDEALQQAELLLKERSLTAYYDEVALKGLQLAANDAQRGVLGAERLERIKRSVRSLVNHLGGRDDGDPTPSRRKPRVSPRRPRGIFRRPLPRMPLRPMLITWPPPGGLFRPSCVLPDAARSTRSFPQSWRNFSASTAWARV
jgi:hypothetical protein